MKKLLRNDAYQYDSTRRRFRPRQLVTDKPNGGIRTLDRIMVGGVGHDEKRDVTRRAAQENRLAESVKASSMSGRGLGHLDPARVDCDVALDLHFDRRAHVELHFRAVLQQRPRYSGGQACSASDARPI